MDAAPKTKGHVKALMHRLYEKAMLWEMVEWQRNPMQLVEIKGISKRQKKPVVLTVEQYYQILALIPPALPHDGDGGAVHRPSGRRGAGA